MSTEKDTPLSEADEHFALLEQAKAAGFKIDDGAAVEPAKDDVQARPEADGVNPPETTDAGKQDVAGKPENLAATRPDDEPFPGFNALPEETRHAIQSKLDDAAKERSELERKWKAQAGQVAPTQQALEQERRARAELQARLKAYEDSKSTANKDKLQATLAKFKEQYPEEADVFGAIKEALDESTGKLSSENNELRSAVTEMRAHLFQQQQRAELVEMHPDAPQILNGEKWRNWLQAIEPELRQYVQSPYARNVAFLIDQYKRDEHLANLLIERESQGQVTPQNPPARKPLEAAPNPTIRRPIAARAANGISSPEADEWVAQIEQAKAAGYS